MDYKPFFYVNLIFPIEPPKAGIALLLRCDAAYLAAPLLAALTAGRAPTSGRGVLVAVTTGAGNLTGDPMEARKSRKFRPYIGAYRGAMGTYIWDRIQKV